MKIIADKAIPFVQSFFQTIGNVVLFDGDQISASDLSDADVLLVRTVTRVDRQLLQDSNIKFVGTATSGHDHIDINYLSENNIGFAHAPGCNARSVAEYVLSSLFVLAEQNGIDLSDKAIGIIGCGHVGSTVLGLLSSLGIRCLVYDPPLQASGSEVVFSQIDEILRADIITIHVPLVSDGAYATRNMVDDDFFASLRQDVILINTSRGEVVDEKALGDFIDSRPDCTVVLDVWQHEPAIDTTLLQKASIATPHIAGYSIDAKFNGTSMIYKQICSYFNTGNTEVALPVLPERMLNLIKIRDYTDHISAIGQAVLASYDIREDDAVMRQVLQIPEAGRGAYFSRVRNNYRSRREFPGSTVSLAMPDRLLSTKLSKLGFTVT